uniref:Ribonuclease A-domain domain-containing protein n=1 Tax=Oryzias latipes TaxID=8090 RepID=A0A3B3H7B7_ORYLA
MKILLSCLLILMLVDDSSLATYESFSWKHVRDSMELLHCHQEMEAINSHISERKCKDSNSFIVSSDYRVKQICIGEGEPYGDKTLSKGTFRIVRCELAPGAKYPDCQYQGSVLTNRKLLVKCENNLPVHFHAKQIKKGQ